MCGIFAYHGPKKSAPELVLEGLKRLEYRGYDSWGIAYKDGQDLKIHKQVGKIGNFDPKNLPFQDSDTAIGEVEDLSDITQISIGHTRWATHGGVTHKNAHPHFNEEHEIAIVHNGIFENYLEVKGFLEKHGHTFHTETDTEVICHLIAHHHRTHSFEESVKLAIKEIEGRYAILAIKKDSHQIIAVRKGSPLIVGVSPKKGEYFIASDIPAFLPYTNKISYIDDDQMVIIEGGEIRFYETESFEQIEKRIIEIDWEIENAEKGDYPHFMIKEIMEQKDTLHRAIDQDDEVIMQLADAINQAKETYLIGCGTAGKVCMVGKYQFAQIAKKHVSFAFGSEFPNYQEFLDKDTLLISVSQSGETADSLEAIKIAKEKGVKIASIVNVESSTMARISDIVVPIKAGPEKAVASTKATTSQLAILTLLAYACKGQIAQGKQLLINAGGQINDMLNPRYEDHIRGLADKFHEIESMYIIGRGANYPMALEAAIKLQEVSYIHAEGFAGGELKHGPLALITEDTPVIAFVANDRARNEILSNAIEVKARGGHIIGVSPENHEVFDFWIKVPDTGNASPIVNIIPIQILAYQLALLRQNDPDMPRNLAKSVTVK